MTGIRPGTWGVCHGSGWLGGRIRAAELAMSKSGRFPAGDTAASWAGHAFVHIGLHTVPDGDRVPAIVEAEYPGAVISKASSHGDAVWASGQPLTDAEREAGVAAVLVRVGERYDWPAFGWFLMKAAGMAVSKNLTPLFTDPHWTICSGMVVVEQEAMGVPLGTLKTAAVQDPSFVCPADLYRWGLDQGWMGGAA